MVLSIKVLLTIFVSLLLAIDANAFQSNRYHISAQPTESSAENREVSSAEEITCQLSAITRIKLFKQKSDPAHLRRLRPFGLEKVVPSGLFRDVQWCFLQAVIATTILRI